MTGTGPPTTAQLAEHLKPALDTDVLLVTDSHVAYRSFASQHGIAHQRINSPEAFLRAAVGVFRK